MSLPVLVAIVAVGISLAVAAVHFTGGSRRASISSEDEALQRFLLDFPAEKAAAVRLTSDGKAAFISLHGSGTGIVGVIGDKFLTRIVSSRDIKRLTLAGNKVSIRFRDFTWPGGEFVFAEPSAAREVAEALDPSLNSATGKA
ncbi:hypothetical protein [Allomesorhizobium camelthorni]|uniref:Uncharacterized protein n=1 Tax=Allomesorhizobium camelthorni TaxID=475069 RepID=A0A6G4WB90_9HYPH|nr:hypothetical protein [Mesorhizobium camelthorni]NGO51387.1 hypothetical protein [Mesorhizobium camelthorni]